MTRNYQDHGICLTSTAREILVLTARASSEGSSEPVRVRTGSPEPSLLAHT